MKTFDEHVDDVIREYGHATQIAMRLMQKEASREMVNEAAKRYARQCCEDLRQRCAENANLTGRVDGVVDRWYVDKNSILNTQIILP